jgi:hypothetical protein
VNANCDSNDLLDTQYIGLKEAAKFAWRSRSPIMFELGLTVSAAGIALSAVLWGIAAVWRADALRIWAKRCHPKGSFQAPAEPSFQKISADH